MIGLELQRFVLEELFKAIHAGIAPVTRRLKPPKGAFS